MVVLVVTLYVVTLYLVTVVTFWHWQDSLEADELHTGLALERMESLRQQSQVDLLPKLTQPQFEVLRGRVLRVTEVLLS
jgi:hypothetical protein